MINWYVAYCKIGHNEQTKAEINLLSQDVDTFNPKAKIEAVRKGEITTKVEPLFPGYLFVRFDPEVFSASKINNTRGIKRLVTFGDRLAYVPDNVVETLKAQFSDKFLTRLPNKGDLVHINIGPFRGLDAIYQEPNGKTRSLLLIKILGSNQAIDMPNINFV